MNLNAAGGPSAQEPFFLFAGTLDGALWVLLRPDLAARLLLRLLAAEVGLTFSFAEERADFRALEARLIDCVLSRVTTTRLLASTSIR